MAIRTAGQNRQLHMLLNQTGLSGHKEALTASFSNGRTESTTELTVQECNEFIKYLNNELQKRKVDSPKFDPNDKAQKMRRKILSICHELGWEDSTGKIDWDRLNSWLQKYGYKKYINLNDYSEKELPTLVTQFENLLKTRYESKHR